MTPRPRGEWHDDDELWRVLRPFLFTRERIDKAPQQAQQAAALAGVSPGAAVLDMPCGVGRHALALLKTGYRVTGVDRTRLYLDEASATAAREGLAGEWVHADMRDFRRDGAFDAAINLYTSLGYFRSEADDAAVLRNMHAALRPGGALVIDTMSREVLARVYTPRSWHEVPGAGRLLESTTVAPDWGSIENRWIVQTPEGERELSLWLRVYSAADLGTLLHGAGFGGVTFHGGLDGSPYDAAAKRLVIVARR